MRQYFNGLRLQHSYRPLDRPSYLHWYVLGTDLGGPPSVHIGPVCLTFRVTRTKKVNFTPPLHYFYLYWETSWFSDWFGG